MACHWFFLWLAMGLALLAPGKASALPVLVAQPVSVNVTYSQNVATYTNVTFTVIATNTAGQNLAATSFQWRHNGAPFIGIPGIESPFGITNTVFSPTDNLHFYVSTLTLTSANAIPSEAGKYSVVVFDADGAVSTTNASLTFSGLPVAPATDSFAARGALSGQFLPYGGTLVATNIGGTKEPGEPDNGGIPGGASVWVKWVASFTGLATFDTSGSDFDTTIGIYTNSNPAASSVGNLGAVASDDDTGVYFGSLARFNAVFNQEYDICINGFYGATGQIMLKWANNTGGGVITATAQPHNVVVTNHANVTLTVDFGLTNNSTYNWSFNGVQLTQTANSSLTISNVTAANVGTYTVNSGRSALFSQPIQLQISDDGFTNSFAQAKFRLATDPNGGLQANVHFHPLATPVSGFSGTRIWNTYGAASEPGEPNHCDKAGGAPYWFSYQAPASGNLTVDANTPTFTNVLAVYTWPGGDFSSLVPVACASTNNGVGDETAVFAVNNGTTYYLVVDGLNAATGPVTLSYNLASPPAAPVILTQPQSQTVSPGVTATLTVGAIGNPPPAYQWRTNTVKFQGQTNASLTVTNFQSIKEGKYDVVVTNIAGSVTSSAAALYLNSPVRFNGFLFSTTGGFSATLLGMANTNYVIQATTNLAKTNWVAIATNSSPHGIIPVADTNPQNYSNRFYRAVSQ